MLRKAITQPDACRAQLDAAVGQPFSDWVRERHSDDDFEATMTRTITEWFGH